MEAAAEIAAEGTGAGAQAATVQPAARATSPVRADDDPGRAPPVARPRARRWVIGGALGLGAAWTWTVAMALPADMSGVPMAAVLAVAVAIWAMPLLLLLLLAQMLLRVGSGDARGAAAGVHELDAGLAQIDMRIAAINRELSLARGFLEAQSRDLESFGRVAVERLGQSAQDLRSLVEDNGARIEAIGEVSTAARANMEALRGQLPVLASAAKDVANNVANAGRVAADHVADLAAGLHRLNDFGLACERQTATVRARVDEAMHLIDARLDDMDTAAEARLTALASRGAELGEAMAARENAAQAAMRARTAALAGEIAGARAQLDAGEAEALASLRARLGAVRDEAATVTRALREGEARALEDWRADLARIEADMRTARAAVADIDRQADEQARARLDSLLADAARAEGELAAAADRADGELVRRTAAQAGRMSTLLMAQDKALAAIGAVEARLAAAAAATETAETTLSQGLAALAAALEASLLRTEEADRAIGALARSGQRALADVREVARIGRDDLPGAFDSVAGRIEALTTHAEALRGALGEAGTRSGAIGENVAATTTALTQASAALAALHDGIAARTGDSQRQIDGVRDALTAARADARALADQAEAALDQAIARLAEDARAAIRAIESDGAAAIAALAANLGDTAAGRLDQTIRDHTAVLTGRIEQSAALAAAIAQAAGQQLQAEIARVEDAVGTLEARVTDARARAEEQIDNDFARRAAAITETLKSHAIDIARALDSDVADTAWAGYLKGDRGIFARRAFKLVEAAEARAILQAYENDDHFRGHVNLYIHDFEGMLRQLLATRDGHALGVTLLSSDMGKLYVALAQAIDRLRN